MNLLNKKINDFQKFSLDDKSIIDTSQYENLSNILKKVALTGQKTTLITAGLKEEVESIIADFRDTNEVVKGLNKDLKKENKGILKGILGYLDTFETLYLILDDIKDKNIKDTLRVCLDVYEQTNEVLGIREIKVKVGDDFKGEIHHAIDTRDVADILQDNKIVEVSKVGFVRGRMCLEKHV